MSTLGRMYRGETDFDFVGRRRTWFAISATLVLVSLLSLAVRQLNPSIDFQGGVAVQVENQAGASVEDMRSALAPLGLADARIQELSDGDVLRVQTRVLGEGDEQAFLVAVAETSGVRADELSIEAVGATFGEQITRRAIEALLIFLGAVVLFITWRFEWKMALAGLAALTHDLIITAGVYSITGFEVTPATVVAILTILGYSLYDTVVVFDKVNEQVIEFGEDHTYSDIVNRSMNEVLMRSINTSLTSLLPVGSLLFIGSYLLGATTLREFALALFVGIAAGTYSSIAVASPLLATWKEREPAWERKRRKLHKEPEPPVARPEPVAATSPIRQGRSAAKQAPAAGSPASGAVPRPPKKRRKRR